MGGAAEIKWHLATNEVIREELADTVCFMLMSFGVGLRGEEVLLLSMEGLMTFWEESRSKQDRFIMLNLKGRFKGKVNKRWHLVPVSDFTQLGLPYLSGCG